MSFIVLHIFMALVVNPFVIYRTSRIDELADVFNDRGCYVSDTRSVRITREIHSVWHQVPLQNGA